MCFDAGYIAVRKSENLLRHCIRSNLLRTPSSVVTTDRVYAGYVTSALHIPKRINNIHHGVFISVASEQCVSVR